MTLPFRSLFRRRRVPLLVVLLMGTLVLAGVLAYQAQDAARSQRAAAERTLRDYAEFAAMGFALHAKDLLYSRMYMSVRQMGDKAMHVRPGEGPIRPLAGGKPVGTEQCPKNEVMYFRMHFADGTLQTNDICRTARIRQWLTDTVPMHAKKVAAPNWEVAYIYDTIDGDPRVIAYSIKRNAAEEPVAAWGLETHRGRAARPLLAHIMEHTPLLPPSLTGGAPNEEFLAVQVANLDGQELYRSAVQYPPTYSGEMVLEERFGGLVVRVALAPAAADQLMIGGLPRSRLPLLIGLFLLVTGLVAAALRLLQREVELARLRSGFIANVSHELRTPLAQIRMFAETLLLGRVRSENESRRSLEIIDQEARRLTNLVENVLQYSRAERQVIQFAPERTRLAGEIREAIECFAPIAAARNVTIATALDDDAVAMVDRNAFRQVLTNLLDNAVKYGPSGQTVTIGLIRSGDRARIRIDDQGSGIPPLLRERIWEPFYRVRNGGDATTGSGIGLSVVRDLVQLHHGRCWVEEGVGGGARFVVELPLGTDARAGDGATPLAGSAPQPSLRA